MSESGRQLLAAFEALTDSEKRDVALEILRRFPGRAEGDVPENALTEIADELFRGLDAEEARHAPR